jgi:hypothetical protein
MVWDRVVIRLRAAPNDAAGDSHQQQEVGGVTAHYFAHRLIPKNESAARLTKTHADLFPWPSGRVARARKICNRETGENIPK